ncbi:glutamyl-tRNA synthetase [Aspergillus luchuensis]|uniref:Glutamyl-tRNA synthetase n=1 Tax=Aspergillus kawachii TaxID=1069201 RepID=A0A146FUR1_ASPKA|nr:glutamyl-tRNA synthetase [Aspergillus luchuensis]
MLRRPTTPTVWARRPWVCTQCRARYSSVAPASNLRAGNNNTINKKTKLPDSPARTRFAPSPTGYLHLGSLRTALFNYLLAKRTGGQFLLRIEDTDQSERTAIYRSHAQELIENGHAYRCFCSADRLDAFARHRSQAGLPAGYDRKCGEVSAEESEERAAKGEAHVVRLKVEGYPMFNDLVYGKTGQNRSPNKLDLIERVYDDPILIKSDGHPTYHLANVVDDHLMKITHVIRGTEWMPSTPMHVALYNAFKWTPPQFGHVPLLVDKSGQKLSKRNADIDLSFFKDTQGVFAATLVNFAALLGWSHTQKSDIFNLEELEQLFNLKITRGNTVVAFEKLWFLQKAHAQRFAATDGPEFTEMVTKVSEEVEKTYPAAQLTPLLQSRSLQTYIAPLLRADAKSYTNATDFITRNSTFFTQSLTRPPYTPSATTTTIPLTSLHTASFALTLVPPAHWTLETHRANITAYDGTTPDTESATLTAEESTKAQKAADKAFKKELYHYLRWALSAGAPGPGIPETMAILGREETVRRVQEAKELTAHLVPGPTRRVKQGVESLGEDRSWMGSLAPSSGSS